MDGEPLQYWMHSLMWLGLLALLGFLMVSTWRYPSFKEINVAGPRSPLSVVLFGALIYLIWTFPQPVLLGISTTYVASGILLRIGGAVRRRTRPTPAPEHQVG